LGGHSPGGSKSFGKETETISRSFGSGREDFVRGKDCLLKPSGRRENRRIAEGTTQEPLTIQEESFPLSKQGVSAPGKFSWKVFL